MIVYAAPAYSTYSHPTLYPFSRLAPARVPSARERYLQALADAQLAREQYYSEIEEEQRLLANLRQQEALRQAEIRHRQALVNQYYLTRRRGGRLGTCHPSFFVSTSGRPTFVRQQPEFVTPDSPQQNQLDVVEELVKALLGGHEEQQKRKEQKSEESHVQHNAKVHFVNERDALSKNVEVPHGAHVQQAQAQPSSSPSPNVAARSSQIPKREEAPFHSFTYAVPLRRQAEIVIKRRSQDRAARTIQRQWRSHSADKAAHKEAIATIEALRARFQFLKDNFSFPEHLEFKDVVEDQGAKVPQLLYTPSNVAVHMYTHELTKLLMRADAVSSGGSRRVREARRSFVRSVEDELEDVENRVGKIWGKRTKGTAGVRHKSAGPEAQALSAAATVTPEAIQEPSQEPMETSPEDRENQPVVDNSATFPTLWSSGEPTSNQTPVESLETSDRSHDVLPASTTLHSDNFQPVHEDASPFSPRQDNVESQNSEETEQDVTLTALNHELAGVEAERSGQQSDEHTTNTDTGDASPDVVVPSNIAETEATSSQSIREAEPSTPRSSSGVCQDDPVDAPSNTVNTDVLSGEVATAAPTAPISEFDIVYPDLPLTPSNSNTVNDMRHARSSPPEAGVNQESEAAKDIKPEDDGFELL